MQKNFICPFCQSSVSITSETERTNDCYFGRVNNGNKTQKGTEWENRFIIYMRRCPSCENVSVFALGVNKLRGIRIPLFPSSLAKQYPDFIPKAIREDYEEAYSILSLSPKASATLSRRCLQGMIRDFWKTNVKSGKLYDEINAIKDKISPSQWKAIDSLRSLGNIGAHMEKDVNEIIEIDDGEAEKLIKLIELLMEKWYIARHDEEKLLSEIVEIKNEKNSKHVTTKLETQR